MQTTTHSGIEKPLLTKERKIGSEAPAISLKMNSGEEKVIGMMATKVQVIITLPFSTSLSDAMQEIINILQIKPLSILSVQCLLQKPMMHTLVRKILRQWQKNLAFSSTMRCVLKAFLSSTKKVLSSIKR